MAPTSRDLDGGERPPTDAKPARAHVGRDRDDQAGAIDEHDVDREAHAEGVDALCRCDDQGFVVVESFAPEQALPTCA